MSGSGRVLVPINFRLNADEIAYIVEHSGASMLLVDPELDDALASVQAKHRFVLGAEADEELYRFGVEPGAVAEPDEDATATINYTSGTTARPKGVQMTHRNIWINATTFGWQAGVSDRDVYLHTLPMFHCNGWGMPYAVTGHGRRSTSCCARSTAPRSCAASSEHGVTLLCGAPAVVTAVLDAAPDVGRARSPAAAARGSSWPARRRRRARSSGSRPSSAGSSSRSTGSPRRRRCSR